MPAALPAKGAFGITLRSIREKAALTQDDLADASGVGQPQISRYETGKGEPTIGEVVAFEVALGMQRGDLLIASGYVAMPVTARDAIERDPLLPEEVRDVLLGGYDVALAAHRRRQRPVNYVDEGPKPGEFGQ